MKINAYPINWLYKFIFFLPIYFSKQLFNQKCYHKGHRMKMTAFLVTAKKWSFSLRISSVNVTKSAVFCGIIHIYWRSPQWKFSFFVQCIYLLLFFTWHFSRYQSRWWVQNFFDSKLSYWRLWQTKYDCYHHYYQPQLLLCLFTLNSKIIN